MCVCVSVFVYVCVSVCLCVCVTVANPCSDQNGGCMHMCLPDGSRAHCDCKVGFLLAEDGKTCEGNTPSSISSGGQVSLVAVSPRAWAWESRQSTCWHPAAMSNPSLPPREQYGSIDRNCFS